MNFVFEQNGVLTPMNSREDYLRAIGGVGAANVVMTDESGRVVGAGQGAEMMHKSMPMFEALNKAAVKPAKTMMKSVKAKAAKPMLKSHVSGSRAFDTLIADLQALAARTA